MEKKTSTSGISRLLKLSEDLERQAALVESEDINVEKEEAPKEETPLPAESDKNLPESNQKEQLSPEKSSYEISSSPEKSSYEKSSDEGGSSEKSSYEISSSPEKSSYEKSSYEERSYEISSSPEKSSYEKSSDEGGSSEKSSYEISSSPEKSSYEKFAHEDPSNFVKLDQIRAYTFTQIVPFVLRQSGLSAQARIVLVQMLTESIRKMKPVLFVKNNELTNACGTTYRTVFQVLHDLDEKKWIFYVPSKNNRSGSEVSLIGTYARFIEETGIVSTCEEIFGNLSSEEITYDPYCLVCYVGSKDLKHTNIQNNKDNKESENQESENRLFFSQYQAFSNVIGYALMKNFEPTRTNKNIINKLLEMAGFVSEGQTVSSAAELFQVQLQRAIFYVSTKNAKNKWSYLIRALEEKWYDTLSLDQIVAMDTETALFTKVMTDPFYIDAMGLPELREISKYLPEVIKGDKITNRSINTVRDTFKKYFGGIATSVEEMLKKWGIASRKASEEL